MQEAQDRDEDNVAGQRIGKYQLIRRLAQGGMAELFLARATGLEGFQKVCAIKRILPHLAKDADFVEMFLAEARLSAKLEHPNIVPVFDFGKAGDDYFFAMPYIHGRDLLAILRGSQKKQIRLPLAQAISVAIGVASGLHYTHEQVGYDGEPLGIVHRDISPANVMVTFDGHIKVADFGIAKAAAQTTVTKVGVRKGKAAYMSPEQVRGDDLDRRSDVFSIGVVLWEMVTMRRLFRGDNDLSIMHRIVTTVAPPPSSAASDLPTALDAVIGRCLHPDPSQRYQTAQELQQALKQFASDYELEVGPAAMAAYLEQVFGPQDPAWASQLALSTPLPSDELLGAAASGTGAGGPSTSVSGSGDSFRAAGTAHIHRTDEVTHGDLPFGHGRPKPVYAAVLGTGLGLVMFGGWWVATTPEPTPKADPVKVVEGRTEEPPAVVADGRDARDLLNLVNQDDWTLALQYEPRHTVLERLEKDAALSAAVDARLNVALDLVQAGQSPAPCDTYDTALAVIEARPDSYFVSALRAAEPPTGTTGCPGDLSGRRATLLARLAPVVEETVEPDEVEEAEPVEASKPKPRPKSRPKSKPKSKPKPEPEPAADPPKKGGLRPFGQ